MVILSRGPPEQGKALPLPNTSGGPKGSCSFKVWMLITDVACDCLPQRSLEAYKRLNGLGVPWLVSLRAARAVSYE